MFFSGRLPKPPWETRARVAALVKQYDRAPHPELRRSVPVHDASVALRGVRRSLGSRTARPRGRPGRTVRAEDEPTAAPRRRAARGPRSFTSPRFAIRCGRSDKLHDALRFTGRGAPRRRRRGRAVPPVRGARQESGREAARPTDGRGRVPRGGEGRQSELHRASAEGRRRRDAGCVCEDVRRRREETGAALEAPGSRCD